MASILRRRTMVRDRATLGGHEFTESEEFARIHLECGPIDRRREVRLSGRAPQDRRPDGPQGHTDRCGWHDRGPHRHWRQRSPSRCAPRPSRIPANPATSGTVTDTIISPGSSAVRFTPTMKSVTGIVRRPPGPANSTMASRAASTGSPSPAGEQVPRLPPSVPALRICGEPTVRAACASAGSSSARGPISNSR